MKKLIIAEPINLSTLQLENYREALKKHDIEIIAYENKPSDNESLALRIENANLLVVSNLPLPAEVLCRAKKLEMISVAFTGTDHVDTDFCISKNIRVCNAAGYSTHAVAELSIGLAIDLARKITAQSNAMQKDGGKWRFTGNELYGKTFGIFGAGRIGLETARLAEALGCRVLVCSRTEKKHCPYPFVNKQFLLQESDFVSLHLPLTGLTRHFIAENELKIMKPTAFLINTARGGCIDTNALSEALQKGTIAGAASDVFETEPPLQADHPLIRACNHITLPHIGFATEEAFATRGDIVLENILNFIAGINSNVVV